MAEEPLLINFSLGSESILPQQRFKGGRWKERRGFTKSSRATGVNAENIEQRPAKRQRVDNTPRVPSLSDDPRRTAPPNGVISSLFSFNPEAQSLPEEEIEATPAQPTNAPLIDGIDSFTSLGLDSTIAAHLLTKMNLKAPTAIQKATISRLLSENSDAFIQAETGSGKTLAYLLPIVHRLISLSEENQKLHNGADHAIQRSSGLFAIILAPTRELSKQIHTVLESLLSCARWIVSGTVIGGEKKKSEKARLRKGFNILVATPGRLVDHLANTKVLDVSNVRWLVLDEGDRLMELGFEEDIKKIMHKLSLRTDETREHVPGLPSRTTTILCSATMRTNVNRLGELTLKDAIHVQVDPLEQPSETEIVKEKQLFSAPAQLQQSYVTCPAKQRLVTLHALLKKAFARRGSTMKAIVFFTCADSVDFHSEVFSRKDEKVEPATASLSELPTVTLASQISSTNNPKIMLYKLYGNLSQQMRTATLKAFSADKNPAILFCTDVASRGLDLPSIDLVVEYDPAFSAEEHLHRIGRTARAGNDGRAVVFLMPGPEEGYIPILKQGFKDSRVHGSTAEDVLRKGFAPAIASKSSITWEDSATEWQLEVERWIQAETKTAELARKAYISHVRAYATHTGSERHIFDVKELHLGHLAKAFALRDKPSNMSRGGKEANDKRSSKSNGRRSRNGGIDSSEIQAAQISAMDPGEAARQMRKALKAINPASEFNIA